MPFNVYSILFSSGSPCTYRCTVDTRSGFVSSVSSDSHERIPGVMWRKCPTQQHPSEPFHPSNELKGLIAHQLWFPCTISNDLVLPSYKGYAPPIMPPDNGLLYRYMLCRKGYECMDFLNHLNWRKKAGTWTHNWQAPLTREPVSPLTFVPVTAIDWRLSCVGMRVLTWNGHGTSI